MNSKKNCRIGDVEHTKPIFGERSILDTFKMTDYSTTMFTFRHH